MARRLARSHPAHPCSSPRISISTRCPNFRGVDSANPTLTGRARASIGRPGSSGRMRRGTTESGIASTFASQAARSKLSAVIRTSAPRATRPGSYSSTSASIRTRFRSAVTVHELRVTSVQSASSREVTSSMRPPIRPTRANNDAECAINGVGRGTLSLGTGRRRVTPGFSRTLLEIDRRLAGIESPSRSAVNPWIPRD